MGAAGLTCSTCEMGSRGGTGIEIELDTVPQRETGMTPYEIMLSESQERMLLVAEKGREDEVFRVFQKWGLDAVDHRRGHRRRHAARARSTARSWPRFPTASWPTKRRSTTARTPLPLRAAPMEAPAFRVRRTWPATCSRCSPPPTSAPSAGSGSSTTTWSAPTRWRARAADAAIVRIKETGTSVAMALDGNGRYCYLSPREGAKLAVAECCRNLSVVGAQPVAATNCLNFGNPERPEIMAQLVEAIEGMARGVPLLRDADHRRQRQPLQRNARRGHLPHAGAGHRGADEDRRAGDHRLQERRAARVILLGGLGECDETRFGGTQYAKAVLKQLWGLPPALDMDYEKRVQAAMREIVGAGLAESAHDLSDGGLAVALAECSFGPAASARALDLDSDLRPEFLLFHEGPSRILISTARAGRGGGASRRGTASKRSMPALPSRGRIEIRNRGASAGGLGHRGI